MAVTTYSTSEEVKDVAGMTGNSDVDTIKFDVWRKKAYAYIIGVISRKYDVGNLVVSNSDFLNSPAHEFLKGIEMEMAAGYYLRTGQGPNTAFGGESSPGEIMVQSAKDELVQIFVDESGMEMKLLDNSNTEFTRNSSDGTDEVPQITDIDDDDVAFSFDDKY